MEVTIWMYSILGDEGLLLILPWPVCPPPALLRKIFHFCRGVLLGILLGSLIGYNEILGPLCWPVTGTIYLILFLRRADPLINTSTIKIFLESGKFSSIYIFSVRFMHWKLLSLTFFSHPLAFWGASNCWPSLSGILDPLPKKSCPHLSYFVPWSYQEAQKNAWISKTEVGPHIEFLRLKALNTTWTDPDTPSLSSMTTA